MPITPIPSHLKALPHGIDITAPGGIDALFGFHRSIFGDAQMNSNAGASGSGDGDPGKQKQEPRTFSQDELNAFLAEERRKTEQKFAGYDDLKAKADELDQVKQENQTELQKAIARAEKAEKTAADERSGREAAERQSLAATVASEKGVPSSHISGTSREELEKSADQLIAWRTGNEKQEDPPKPGGYVPLSGTGNQGPAPATMSTGRDRALAKHSKNQN